MAEKFVHIDKDFKKNKIKNSRIPDVPSNEEHDEDAINRKYVNDKNKFITTLSENQNINVVEKFGGIDANTPSSDVSGKTTQEILDLALFPLKSPNYDIPTSILSIKNKEDIVLQSQFKTDIVLECIVEQNDSSSIISYTFSGDGINTPVTQPSNIFTIQDYITNSGLNNWSVVVNYDEAIQKKDSHFNDDNNGKFIAGSISSSIELETLNPILTSVDYNEEDATIKTPLTIMDFMDGIRNFKNTFYIEVGNNKKSSINFAIPFKYADVRVTMNETDITDGFKKSLIEGVKPWGVGSGIDYTVYHMKTNIKYKRPKVIKVEVFEKYFTGVFDVSWHSVDNKIEIDNDGLLLDSWNDTLNTPIASNKFSINDVSTPTDQLVRIVSTVGFIKKVELGKPFKIFETNSSDITINDGFGKTQKLELSQVYKFKIWVQLGLVPNFSTKISK